MCSFAINFDALRIAVKWKVHHACSQTDKKEIIYLTLFTYLVCTKGSNSKSQLFHF